MALESHITSTRQSSRRAVAGRVSISMSYPNSALTFSPLHSKVRACSTVTLHEHPSLLHFYLPQLSFLAHYPLTVVLLSPFFTERRFFLAPARYTGPFLVWGAALPRNRCRLRRPHLSSASRPLTSSPSLVFLSPSADAFILVFLRNSKTAAHTYLKLL